jgi:tungstate transport system ATP-binding protein
MSGPVLEVRDLQVRRGSSLILDIPLLQVEPNKVLVLIGPNGAGKTTLLLTLALLTPPSSGEIKFEGKSIDYYRDLISLRRRFAVVFQEPLLFDTSVFGNVAAGLKVRGVRKHELRERVFTWLDQFGIAHLAGRAARTLSGGEAQRVSLARALVLNPQTLFMDEPFAALDPPTREMLIQDMERIFQQTKITTVFVTHDRSEALQLAHRIGIMHQGKIIQLDLPERIISHPANEMVANFMGVESILPGRVVDFNHDTFLVKVAGKAIEVTGEAQVGDELFLCIRPEEVTLLKSDLDPLPSSARNIFPGRVIQIGFIGPYCKVTLDCGFSLVAYITKKSLEKLNVDVGTEVMASFKATGIHVIRK